MSYWQTNFDKVKEQYHLVFEVLEKAFEKFEIDFYLIGAQSRDVWTNHLPIDKRITRDIDYSVYIANYKIWDQLNEYLINEEGFKRDEKEPYRIYFKGDIIDLIPFGGIEKNGKVILQNPPMELSVFGCKEIMEEALVIRNKYKVVTLPGLCIMKLVAFDEKPGSRAKDWDDFIFLLINYSEIAGNELFEGYHDDLIENDFEMPVASARLLGRNMKSILNKNEKLFKKIIQILEDKLRGFTFEEIDQMYVVRDIGDRQVEQMKLIAEVIKGVRD